MTDTCYLIKKHSSEMGNTYEFSCEKKEILVQKHTTIDFKFCPHCGKKIEVKND